MATTTHIKVPLAAVPRTKASPEPKVKSATADLSFTATWLPSVVSQGRHYPPSNRRQHENAIAASTSATTVPETVVTARTATSTRLTTALTTDIGSTPTTAPSALPDQSSPSSERITTIISAATTEEIVTRTTTTAVTNTSTTSTVKAPLTMTYIYQSTNSQPSATNTLPIPSSTTAPPTDTTETAVSSLSRTRTLAPTSATTETWSSELPSPSPASRSSPPPTFSPMPSPKPPPVVQPPTIRTTTGALTAAPLPPSHSSIKATIPTAKTAFTTRYVTTVSVITITTLIPQKTRLSGSVTTIYVTRATTTLITISIPDPSQVLPRPSPSPSSTDQDAITSTIECWQFVVGVVSALVIALVVAALLFRGWLNKRQRDQAIQDFLASSNGREVEEGRGVEGGRVERIVEGAGFMRDRSPIVSGRTAWGGRGKGRQDYDDANGYEFNAGSPSSTVVSGHDFGHFYLHYQPMTAPPALPETWYQAPTLPSFPLPPPPIATSGVPVTRGNTDSGKIPEGAIWIERGTQTLHSFPLELRTESSLQRDQVHLKKANTGGGGGGSGGWKSSKGKNRFQWPWKVLRSTSSSADMIALPPSANTVPRQDPQRRPRDPQSLLVSSISVESGRPSERQQKDQKGKQRQAPRNPHGEPNAIEDFVSGDIRQDRCAPHGPYPMPRLLPPISVSTRFWDATDESGDGSGSGSSSSGGGGILSRCHRSPSSPTVVEPELGPQLSTSTTVVSSLCSSSPIWSNTLVTMVSDRSQMQTNLDNQRTWPGPRGVSGGHGHRRGGQCGGGGVVDNQSTLPVTLLVDQLEKFSKIELLRKGPQALLLEQLGQPRSRFSSSNSVASAETPRD